MPIDVDRMRAHVTEISSVPRPAESERLEIMRQYVTRHFQECGWTVERAPFVAEVEVMGELRGINLIAQHARHPITGGPRLCIGAHLDSRADTPGADDNASAVATLLELARNLNDEWPRESRIELELVAFDLEEWGMVGGANHAQRCRAGQVDLRGMISLEMLGYCDHRRNTQQLPRTLIGLYPDTANFIALIGNQNSEELISALRDGMRPVTELPVETLLVPENGNLLQATRLSDHSPFWDAGYAAAMITDTSFLRNPHYHLPTDTVETLDFEFLHRVSEGCLSAVHHLLRRGLAPAREVGNRE